MNNDLYELIALAARYFFSGLMVLIALRAAYGALTDSQRASRLRRLSPLTGLSGELIVLRAVDRVHQGMRYPVIREGMIGASSKADVRIRHRSVRRRHAYFQLSRKGFHIRSHAGARLRDALGRPVRELTLQDGDGVIIGDVPMMLVLNFADNAARLREKRPDPFARREAPEEDWMEPEIEGEPDPLFPKDGWQPDGDPDEAWQEDPFDQPY